MGWFTDQIKNMGGQIANNAAGGITSLIGNIGQQGRNDRADNRQVDLQNRLNENAAETNYYWGNRMAQDAFNRQMQMYNQSYRDESFQNQVKQMEDAGLSVGLMMSGGAGAAGGMGQASTAPQGTGAGATPGQASRGSETEANRIAREGMALQSARLRSEIEVNESIAEKNRAEAEGVGATTTTENEKRNYLIETLRQEGIAKWIENNIRKTHAEGMDKDQAGSIMQNEAFGEMMQINKDSWLGQKWAVEIAEAYARTGESTALAELNSERKKGYWTELLNATMHAEADKAKAAAIKLAAEWDTGEYTNWKTWTEVGQDVVKTIGQTVTGFMNPVKKSISKSLIETRKLK